MKPALRYTLFFLGIYLMGTGTWDLVTDLRHSEPVELSVKEFLTSGTSIPYITLSDGQIDLRQSIPLAYTRDGAGSGQTSRLLIPIHSNSSPQLGMVKILLDTNDPEYIFLAKKLASMNSLDRIHYSSDFPDKVIIEGPYSGRVSKKVKSLDAEKMNEIFQLHPEIRRKLLVISHNELPDAGKALGMIGVGLLFSGFSGYLIYLSFRPHLRS